LEQKIFIFSHYNPIGVHIKHTYMAACYGNNISDVTAPRGWTRDYPTSVVLQTFVIIFYYYFYLLIMLSFHVLLLLLPNALLQSCSRKSVVTKNMKRA